MYHIYERNCFTYHIELRLITDFVAFKSRKEAFQSLLNAGFMRHEISGQFAIMRLKKPPVWIRLPGNYNGELR